MSTPPTPERVRLTISVAPEVHEAFRRLSTASRIPIGRAMGEWLGDTLEAVEFTALKVEQARSAPRIVMQEMHAYAQGMSDETGALLARVRREATAAREKGRSPSRAAVAPLTPPVSNTGGKVPQNKAKGSKK